VEGALREQLEEPAGVNDAQFLTCSHKCVRFSARENEDKDEIRELFNYLLFKERLIQRNFR
jgi:hypothetical protein